MKAVFTGMAFTMHDGYLLASPKPVLFERVHIDPEPQPKPDSKSSEDAGVTTSTSSETQGPDEGSKARKEKSPHPQTLPSEVGVLCLDARAPFSGDETHCHVWGAIAALNDGIQHGIEFLVVKLALTENGHEELRNEMTVYAHLARAGAVPMLTERVRLPRYYGLYREKPRKEADAEGFFPMLALVMSLETGEHPGRDHTLNERQWRDLREAVERLHESGVCHLDLAPRNVLLNKDNTLTIIDFGRASLTNDAVARQQDLDALDTNF
ncbi:hypothetical protein C8Q76DRAFT_791515 [Earliella scabrosa]|nr:hypothetical protein C8Q76DRAFT_791515 [Earliella scabrosa]